MKGVYLSDLPPGIRRRLGEFVVTHWRRHARKSYSQEGEDLILERLFAGQRTGFYVDVGAHHPRRYSNTQRFYEHGWNGINIEPNPDALAMFNRQRKRDINVGCGVADREGQLVYFMFQEAALNTFDPALAERNKDHRFKFLGTKDIPVRRLDTILEGLLPGDGNIDFMSIDVEGYDLQVLQSNDWSRFRPSCLLVEAFDFDLSNPNAFPIHTFLDQHDYGLFAKTFNTVFYRDRRTNQRHLLK